MWKEKLQKASFRGIPFFMKSADTQVGRRINTHEFPYRDDAEVEDMGKAARGFSVSAFVIGNDYIEKRDALIEALEKRGSGILVHPYYGIMSAALTEPARISENMSKKGGIAEFSISFIAVSEREFTQVLTNTKENIQKKAAQLEKTAAA